MTISSLYDMILSRSRKQTRSWRNKMIRNNRDNSFYTNDETKTITRSKNKNAVIRVVEEIGGKLRTETARRDEDTASFAITTNYNSNSSALYIDLPNSSIRLSGTEARTLYRLLNKHYSAAGKSV